MPTDFNDDDYPLLRLHAHGESSDRDVDERIAFIQRHLERHRKVALIFDTSGSKPLTARQRRMWTDWLAEHDLLIRRYLIGCALVVTSAVNRGVFTGVFWVWRPPMPYTFVATPKDAEAWARARLAAAGE